MRSGKGRRIKSSLKVLRPSHKERTLPRHSPRDAHIAAEFGGCACDACIAKHWRPMKCGACRECWTDERPPVSGKTCVCGGPFRLIRVAEEGACSAL